MTVGTECSTKLGEWQRLRVALAVWLMSTSVGAQQPTRMADDVARMVRASQEVGKLMPWSAPVPEIDLVVRHGKAIVPQLIVLLPDDPDDPDLSYNGWDASKILAGEQFDWRVEQDAAVALCRIYRLPETTCPRYSNRAMREQNKGIRPFWLKTIAENP